MMLDRDLFPMLWWKAMWLVVTPALLVVSVRRFCVTLSFFKCGSMFFSDLGKKKFVKEKNLKKKIQQIFFFNFSVPGKILLQIKKTKQQNSWSPGQFWN